VTDSIQWEWYGFGGYGAGIIFPWPSYPDKLVVLREDGDTWGQRTVIDPDLKGDVEKWYGFTMAGDARGTVHLVYEREWFFIFAMATETRYVRIPSITGGEEDRESRGAASSDNIALAGYYSTKVVPNSKFVHFTVAADPDSGTALFVSGGRSQKIRNDRFDLPRIIRLPMGSEQRVASAGSGDFHAAVLGEKSSSDIWTPSFGIYYLSNQRGGWSSPVELGDGALVSKDTFLLVSDASSRAFVTWGTDNGLVGRWVELEESEASELSRKKPESRNH
jgi:hypothetical protein